MSDAQPRSNGVFYGWVIAACAMFALLVSNGMTISGITGVPDQSCLAITLVGVQDLAGNPLGGSNKIYIRVLQGDTNGDGQIGAADITQTKSRNGTSLGAGTLTTSNFRSDVNCDGQIGAADITFVKSHNGRATTCP